MRIIFDEYSVLAPPFTIGKAVRIFCSLISGGSKLRTLIMANFLLCADIIASGKLSADVANETKLEVSTENQPRLTSQTANETKLEADIDIKRCS